VLRDTSSPTFRKNVSCQLLSSPSERKISHDTIIFPDKLSNVMRNRLGRGISCIQQTGLLYPLSRGNVPCIQPTGLLYLLRRGYIPRIQPTGLLYPLSRGYVPRIQPTGLLHPGSRTSRVAFSSEVVASNFRLENGLSTRSATSFPAKSY
jgi:hypothetical protein